MEFWDFLTVATAPIYSSGRCNREGTSGGAKKSFTLKPLICRYINNITKTQNPKIQNPKIPKSKTPNLIADGICFGVLWVLGLGFEVLGF